MDTTQRVHAARRRKNEKKYKIEKKKIREGGNRGRHDAKVTIDFVRKYEKTIV